VTEVTVPNPRMRHQRRVRNFLGTPLAERRVRNVPETPLAERNRSQNPASVPFDFAQGTLTPLQGKSEASLIL
jgi:hypothetical protein